MSLNQGKVKLPLHITRCIKNFEKAVEELAFKGAQDPSMYEELEGNYKKAKQDLKDKFQSLLKK